jgi:hypothetical protein
MSLVSPHIFHRIGAIVKIWLAGYKLDLCNQDSFRSLMDTFLKDKSFIQTGIESKQRILGQPYDYIKMLAK